MKNVKVTISFCEADTGVVLNKDGSRFLARNGEEPYRPSFASKDEAQQVKDELLATTPIGEVVIESSDGRQ